MSDTYKTEVEFHLGGNIEEKLHHVGERAREAGERVHETAREFVLLGAGAIGLGLGFERMADNILESNEELENIQKRITGVLFAFQTWKTGVEPIDAVAESMENAEEVTGRFEAAETRLARNMTEIASGYNVLAGPVLGRLGKSKEYLLDLTDKAADAAVVFGMSVDQVATSMTRTLEMGKVRGVDPFSVAMRKAIGDTKHLSREKVFERMEKELTKLGPAAEMMAEGFGATMFRIKDFISDTVRDLGSPAFKYVADQLARFQKYLAVSVGDGRTLGQVYGEKIVSALKTVQDVSGKILEHWKAFAVIWASIKIGSKLEGVGSFIAATTAGGPSAMMGGVLATGLSKFAMNLTQASLALGGLYLATTAFVEWVEKRQATHLKDQGKATQVVTAMDALRSGNAKGAYKVLSNSDLGVAKDGKIDVAAVSSLLGNMEARQFKDFAKSMGMDFSNTRSSDQRENMLASEIAKRFSQIPGMGNGMFGPVLGPKAELTKAPKVLNNFYGGIQVKQDFNNADPDNVWLRMKDDIESQASRRRQAVSSDPYGM